MHSSHSGLYRSLLGYCTKPSIERDPRRQLLVTRYIQSLLGSSGVPNPTVPIERPLLDRQTHTASVGRQVSSLPLREVFLALRTLNDGLLVPWIAPALRGLVLQPLRDHFCSLNGGRELARSSAGLANWQQRTSTQSAQHRESHTRHYCVGCVKNARCAYGRVFEPDLNTIDADLIQRGDTQGVRGLSIATAMLSSEPISDAEPFADSRLPSRPSCTFRKSTRGAQVHQVCAPADTRLMARLFAIGQESIDLIPIVIEAIDAFGQSQGIGYQAPVHCAVEYARIESHDSFLDPNSLSLNTDGGTLPNVTIALESPLLLKGCFEGGRLVPPGFHDLFSNSVRILIRAIREFHHSDFLAEASLSDFFTPSRQIATSQHALIPFCQPSLSHRGPVGRNGYRERDLRGWLGSITFENVPASYLPWLHHAGRLGIGSDRNRGAGLWRVVL